MGTICKYIPDTIGVVGRALARIVADAYHSGDRHNAAALASAVDAHDHPSAYR